MRKLCTSLMVVFFAASSFAADITIEAGKITDLSWTKDNVYRINGLAYVDSLDVLNIEAGTVIKGFPGEAESSSALIISRGGQIIANGTADEPIIFTALADDLAGSVPDRAAGLWGGIVVLGYGQTNNGTQKSIEGISAELDFGLFGGTPEEEVADQDAGEMSYVSIRHGGTNIGEGNEINGLTTGAVGSGTTFSFIEVIGNQDDGVELFGGAPRMDHILVSYCGDDAYDHDHGVRAYMQYLVAIMDTASWGEAFGEHDGGSGSGETSDFFAHPVSSNASFIGNTSGGNAKKKAFVLRDNWSGEYHNSIFADAPVGILVEYRGGGDKEGYSSYHRLMADEIAFQNNIFVDIADNASESIVTVVEHEDNVEHDSTELQTAADAKFATWTNDLSTDPGISIENPVPTGDVSGADFTGLDAWFETVDYKGAFDPAVLCGHWAGGWSLSYADVDYAVVAEDCPDAVNNLYFDAKAEVYPNPATDFVTISFENRASELFTLNIYNLNGQNIMKASTRSSFLGLYVSSLEAGLYTYSLRNADFSINSVGQLVVK